jgi:hypothetical protein
MEGFHIKTEVQNYKDIFPNSRSIIKYAFSINDKDYWEFDDFHEIPCARGFASLTFFSEMSMRCTREYLLAHCSAMEEAINSKTIKMVDIMKLHLQLRERLNFIFEDKIFYKLASVVFFDNSENPYRYEFKYGIEKAKLFSEVNVDDFFLSEPISKLTGSLTSQIPDLKNYCQMMTEINQKHILEISSMLSENEKKNDWWGLLNSQNTMDGIPNK